MTSAADIARALGGRKSTDGFLCRCPLLSHGNGKGDRNPSLLVKDGEKVPLFKCFAGCDTRDIIAELRRRGIYDGTESHRGFANNPRPDRKPDHTPDLKAIAEWGKAWRARGSIVETKYLPARGITIEPPPSIRCSAATYLDHYQLPAMVAAVQAPDRNVIAVQMTLIDPRGHKKAQVGMPRKTIGALGWGAVRLGAAGRELGLAEGVETALSAMQLTGIPCWACIGAARMQRVWIPDEVEDLHLFGDADEAGRAAVQRTAYHHHHRNVIERFPDGGFKDWNDALIAKAGSAVA